MVNEIHGENAHFNIVADYERLVAVYWTKVLMKCLKSTRRVQTAEELCQDIFLRFIFSYHSYQRNFDNVEEYFNPVRTLLGEANRILIDNARRARRRPEVWLNDTAELNYWLTTDEEWINNSNLKLDITPIYKKAYSDLTPLRKQVWDLYCNGYDHQEAAQLLGMTYGAYRGRLFRLRTYFQMALARTVHAETVRDGQSVKCSEIG